MAQRKLEFAVKGMHCAACSARIERVLSGMDEVRSVSVSLATNTAQVLLHEAADKTAAATAVMASIEPLGFTARLLEAGDASASGSVSEAAERWEQRGREQKAELAERRRDLLPAFGFALPLLVLSMGEMAGMPLPGFLDPAVSAPHFALAQLLLCLPVLWSGRRFFLQGLPALWRRSPTMDTLVALGTGAAFLFSLWATVTAALPPDLQAAFHSLPPALSSGPDAGASSAAGTLAGFWSMLFGTGHAAHGVELYYESAAVVIALVSLGKYLEARSRLRTSEAMKGLLDLAPESATRVDGDGGQRVIPLADVRVGDHLLVRPGGRVPVDGVVIDGSSFVDESMLTGESMPVEKAPGHTLAGGTMNQRGALTMRAERVGADTVLARIVKLVQEAQGSKAPIAGLADRISLYFVPAVMLLATLAGLFWWMHSGSGAFALRIFVSVMVIACPCAMGLATPMSIMVGTGRGAQLGVLFKNGQALELSSRINSMVFDKTGTLTLGKPVLMDILPLSDEGLAESENKNSPAPDGRNAHELLRIAASLERSSEHPLARALVEGAAEKNLAPFPVEDFSAVPGKGVFGTVRTDSGPVRAAVGNAAFARERVFKDAGADQSFASLFDSYAGQGKTPVMLLLDGNPRALFAVADPLRPEAPAMVAALKAMGIDSVMLTGDNPVTARAVAARAGIDRVIAGVLPEGKEQAVRAMQENGERVVGMVGDGVNDAPALARADVGFAMSSGIDVAVEAGDVVLMRHGLVAVPTALALGRATMRNIRENLFWAFAYNVIGIPFAAGVFHLFGGPVLSPMLAGAAMALSSVSVVANALRLRFFNAKIKANS